MIVELLKHLKASFKVVLISSHILSTLSDVCDEIYLLEKGNEIKKFEKDEFCQIEKYIHPNFKLKEIADSIKKIMR